MLCHNGGNRHIAGSIGSHATHTDDGINAHNQTYGLHRNAQLQNENGEANKAGAGNARRTNGITQVPSMLSVAPNGMEILQTLGDMPSFSRQAFRLCGMDALLEANTKDMSIDGAYFL